MTIYRKPLQPYFHKKLFAFQAVFFKIQMNFFHFNLHIKVSARAAFFLKKNIKIKQKITMSLILGLGGYLQITVNPLLSPPSQISPLPLISPPFQGKKVNKPPLSIKPPPPPLPYLFFTNKSWTVSINHDCKTSSGLTRRMVYLPTG